MCVLEYRRTAIAMNKPLKSGLVFDANFEHPTWKGKSIKTTSPAIRQEDIERVLCYVGQLVNTTGCKVVRVGGVNDHVHILFLLSRDVAISHVVEEIKRNSSRWIKTLATHYRAFAWQNGYGVFSVSLSIGDKTLDYISNQEMHHKRFSFQDEYRQFLLSYGVEYDEAYVFKD